jgi:poly-beta-1,6-N-acetyl-D-glucosamine synthase
VFIDYMPGPLFIALYSAMLLALIIQLGYYGIYLKIALGKTGTPVNEKFPVSVIICARNEAERLKKNLPLILEQDYPYFEVVVVNDCSEDDTEMVLAELKQNYPHLRATTINKDKKFTHGKKLAVTVGIKSAEFDWLVFTDADCRPQTKNWLERMQRNFGHEKEIVLGYGGYYRKKGLLDKFVRSDTMFIAMQYLGLALFGKPYMGVGRNLAYKKQLFFGNKGFSKHYHLMSGDDDLFINQVARKENTAIETDKESFTRSEPVDSFKQWFYQKKRHLTTYPYYRSGSKYLLGLEMFSRLLFYASFVGLLFLNHEIYLVLATFASRLIFQLVVVKSVMKRLKEKYLLLFSPFMDILIPVFNFIVIISNRIGSNNNRW